MLLAEVVWPVAGRLSWMPRLLPLPLVVLFRLGPPRRPVGLCRVRCGIDFLKQVVPRWSWRCPLRLRRLRFGQGPWALMRRRPRLADDFSSDIVLDLSPVWAELGLVMVNLRVRIAMAKFKLKMLIFKAVVVVILFRSGRPAPWLSIAPRRYLHP